VGAQVGGILGMIAALPILAMLKHTFTFYDFTFSRAPWVGDDGAVLIAPSVEARPSPETVAPPEPGAVARSKTAKRKTTSRPSTPKDGGGS
jgi:hypothetical protein